MDPPCTVATAIIYICYQHVMQIFHLNATHEDQTDCSSWISIFFFSKHILVLHSCPLEAEGCMASNCVRTEIQDFDLAWTAAPLNSLNVLLDGAEEAFNIMLFLLQCVIRKKQSQVLLAVLGSAEKISPIFWSCVSQGLHTVLKTRIPFMLIPCSECI